MYNDTYTKIFTYIKGKNGISVKNIQARFGHNLAGIFRHLKKMQENKLIYKIGKTPKVRYYAYTSNTMEYPLQIVTRAVNWAVSGSEQFITNEEFCSTRDVFQARTDRLVSDLKKEIKNESLVYLLVAVTGEIGNNSFDHNLGNWIGVPGVFFGLDHTSRTIVLADRGQGVFATIKRVRPQVHTDNEALEVAFTEMVSGRAPERRGNGLKFVKKVIEENNLHIVFSTGNAVARITGQGMIIQNSDTIIPGSLAYIQF